MGKIFVFSGITHSIYKCHSLWCFARALRLIKNPAEWLLSSLNTKEKVPKTNKYFRFPVRCGSFFLNHKWHLILALTLKGITFVWLLEIFDLEFILLSNTSYCMESRTRTLQLNYKFSYFVKTFWIERKSLKCKFLTAQHLLISYFTLGLSGFWTFENWRFERQIMRHEISLSGNIRNGNKM